MPTGISSAMKRIKGSPLAAKLVSGTFWSLCGSGISRGLVLLTSIIVARVLGRLTFGEFGMVQSTVSTFGMLAGLSLGMATTKYIAGLRLTDSAKAGRVLALCIAAATGAAGTVCMVLVASAPFLAAVTFKAPHLSAPLATGAFLLFLTVINGVQTGALAGFEAFRPIARVNLIAAALGVPISWYCTLHWGVQGALAGLIFAAGIAVVLNQRALQNSCGEAGIELSFSGCWQERQVLWQFAIPAALSSFAVSGVIWLANVMLVNQPDGFYAMGLFNASQQLYAAMLFIPTSLAPMLLSLMSNSYKKEELSQDYLRIVKFSFLINGGITGAISLIVALGSKPILGLYGAEFRDGWLVLVLFCVTALLFALNNVTGSVIASAASMWWGFTMNILWSAVFILFAYLWVPVHGVIGLLMAYVFSYLLHMGWQGLYMIKKIRCLKSANRDNTSCAIR